MKSKNTVQNSFALFLLLAALVFAAPADAQLSAFNYQGRLTDSSVPANVAASLSGDDIAGAVNNGATTAKINDNRLASNFLKFVPGAEQLSVGDANGTAPMINLRGGSTCCTAPGGHTPAFFKVFQNGSFLATGNLGIGVSPMEGKGYRTSWHIYKGGFSFGLRRQ